MIPVPAGVRVWLSVGRTDMRRDGNAAAWDRLLASRRV